MVTDEEYRELLKKVEELEKKMNMMSQTLTTMRMKNDMQIAMTSQKQQEHKKHRDITKYMIDGKTFSKRELVLYCVKKYIDEHTGLTASQLLDVFPDYIQGSLGIVKKIEDAELYAGSSKRYYFSDEDIIHMDDGNYVVCKQWDAVNIVKFLKLAQDLGFEIKSIERKYID